MITILPMKEFPKREFFFKPVLQAIQELHFFHFCVFQQPTVKYSQSSFFFFRLQVTLFPIQNKV
jgi:hypothetical protein